MGNWYKAIGNGHESSGENLAAVGGRSWGEELRAGCGSDRTHVHRYFLVRVKSTI
ncbi:hypothetical protein [Calothrix sp. NIES-2100]|uniref:hypothetical protein n=1 Tax=Calothrix sp. NIES-2100 TaxID=1954172 RepID=UPI0030D793CA